jgi:hypothetical protein
VYDIPQNIIEGRYDGIGSVAAVLQYPIVTGRSVIVREQGLITLRLNV